MMPKPRPPHLHSELTRHQVRVWYVRRGHGARIRLRAEFDTPEFWEEYRAALAGKAPETRRATYKPQTLGWAIDRYRASPDWARLAPATRSQRENIYRPVVEAAGHQSLGSITRDTIRGGRDRRAAHPHSANNFIKSMRSLFAWLEETGQVTVNPTEGVKLLPGANADGYHTWSEEEVATFEARWPLGSRERLAFDLLLYTGLRRGDVVRLGRQHVRDGVLTFRAEKNDALITLPILAPLAESIAATPTGNLSFLVTERGTPFVKESFGNWFADVCSATGVPGRAHGLRKAGATRAANNGATEFELMAIFGWKSPRQASQYTKAANRKHLAAAASVLLMPGQVPNRKSRTSLSGAGRSGKTKTKSGA